MASDNVTRTIALLIASGAVPPGEQAPIASVSRCLLNRSDAAILTFNADGKIAIGTAIGTVITIDPTTGDIYAPGSIITASVFTGDFEGNPTVTGNLTVTGSLAVGGSTVTGNVVVPSTKTLTVSGAFDVTLTVTAGTTVTLPTTGTLATLAGSETLSGKTLATLTGSVQALTTVAGAGAVNVTTLCTDLTSTGTDALTLANGTNGQIKIITMIVDGGDATLTPTTKTGFTTIVFDNVGDSAMLQFHTTLGWMLVGTPTATAA